MTDEEGGHGGKFGERFELSVHRRQKTQLEVGENETEVLTQSSTLKKTLPGPRWEVCSGLFTHTAAIEHMNMNIFLATSVLQDHIYL